MRPNSGQLVFRIVVAILALVPISAGTASVICGLAFPGFEVQAENADAASHFRFLSGIFLAMGLAYWTVALGIGRWLQRFQLLAALTLAGGLARATSLMIDGIPSLGHLIGLSMEIFVVPMLFFWSVRLRIQPQSQ